MIYAEISGVLFLLFGLVQFETIEATPPVAPNPKDPNFTVQYLIKLKLPKVHSPYRKFGLAYDKFNVCELRYDQKVAACHSVLTSPKFTYEILHDKDLDLSCKRRLVDLSEGIETDIKQLSVSTYECPNPYKSEKTIRRNAIEDTKSSIPIHFYVVGGYFRNSIILSYMHASTSSKFLPIRFHTVFLNAISLETLRNLYSQKRKEVYEKQRKSKKFRLIMVDRVITREGAVQRHPVSAESKVQDNEMIKEYTVYPRFMSTFKTVNICGMAQEVKLGLCRQVFEKAAYNLRLSESKADWKFGCIRRKMSLPNSSRRRTLIYAHVTSFKCPISKEITENSFFMASMLKSPGLITFVLFPPFVEKLPDAFVNGLSPKGVIMQPPKLRLAFNRPRAPGV